MSCKNSISLLNFLCSSILYYFWFLQAIHKMFFTPTHPFIHSPIHPSIQDYNFFHTILNYLCSCTIFDYCKQSLKWLLLPSTHPLTHPGSWFLISVTNPYLIKFWLHMLNFSCHFLMRFHILTYTCACIFNFNVHIIFNYLNYCCLSFEDVMTISSFI